MIRLPLQKILFKAWRETIQSCYAQQQINSERSLQVFYYEQISKLLHGSMKVFVEPKFSRDADDIVFPDLVICNSREIICVIELKYQPRATPSYHKDLQTLQYLAKNAKKLSLCNKRYRGEPARESVYKFSANTIYVWAGVHQLDQKKGSLVETPTFAEGSNLLQECYLELHAETNFDTPTNIFKKNH